MSCKEGFIKWEFITIDKPQTIKIKAYDIAFENNNAFNVMVNNYPVRPNIPFIINSLQPGKKFCQSFDINFGANTGSIIIHQNLDSED